MEKFITSDKVFYHLDVLNDWKQGKLVRPITFEIHPSNRCNNNCYYCYASRFRDGAQMSKADIENAIKKIYKMGARGLIFSGGGEPLCNPSTVDAVKFAKKVGFSVGFISNGLLINQDTAEALLKNCQWVRISLDSLDPKTYKKIRGVDGLKQAEIGIKTLLNAKAHLKSKCTIGIQAVINKYNYLQIFNFVKLAEEKFKEINYIQIRPLEIFLKSNPYSKKELVSISKQLRLISEYKYAKKTIISSKWDLVFGKREYGSKCCYCYGMIGAVDAHGDIYICCHMTKVPKFKYGNIIKDSAKKIFENREKVACLTIKDKLDKLCPVGCRGSAINRRLEGLLHKTDHKDFL